MAKLLSIGIPTYNRADELNRQLQWLANEIKGFEAECDVTIYDNCSTDQTSAVVDYWRSAFSAVPLRYVRQPSNMGGLPNYASFLREATGTFAWAIGDDDPINPGTLAVVLKQLKESQNLALLYLNFSDVHKITGRVERKNWFDTHLESYAENGADVFQHSIEKQLGAVIFITAAIYRTDLVKAALHSWPDSIHNWAGMAYWTGYCARYGDVLITKDTYIVCLIGNSHWQKEDRIHARIYCKDIPEVCYKLKELGYSRKMCRRVVLNNLQIFHWSTGYRTKIKALQTWPKAIVATITFLCLPFFSTSYNESFLSQNPCEVEVSRSQRRENSPPSS
jgi:glycosyltransferase involved in cell wall biosynthesis